MTSTKSKEIAEEYISSLADLTLNSKPLINMLTMLADDNVEHATAIVEAVENHLQKVRPEIKLPVLYLIDSIVKNVNGSYLNLFTQNIVNTFCGVFEKVDEQTRASMWKLRQTWKDVFPAKKLFSLDVRVQGIDPAWPITASSPTISSGSIHLNPRFLAMSQTTQAPLVPPVKVPAIDPASQNEAVMREQLLKKQKELLELQKQKIELELLQAKNSLEQQQRQLDKQTAAVKTETIVPTAHVVPTTEIAQGKPVAPVVPSQATKQVAKQFPAATASLLKNAGQVNGPKIAPASSLLVASARQQVSRDPRLKISSSDLPTSGSTESRIPQLTTVLSDQLKQQLLTKQSSNAAQQQKQQTSLNINCNDDTTILSTSNNDNNSNINNNKLFCGSNISKDAANNLHHRTSQKSSKDIRCNLNSNSNIVLPSPTTTTTTTLSIDSAAASAASAVAVADLNSTNNIGIMSSSSSRNFSNDGKSQFRRNNDNSRDMKLSSDRNSRSDKSKSSSRKIGTKTRSKQPQLSPNKMPKVDRDISPIRSKDNNSDNNSSSPNSHNLSSPIQSSSSLSSSSLLKSSESSSSSINKNNNSRKKIGKSRKRSPSPPYRIPRRNIDAKLSSTLLLNNNNNINNNSSSSNTGGLMEEEQSGSLIVSPPHPPTFKSTSHNAKTRNYMRRNKDDVNSSPDNTGNVGNLDGDDDSSLVDVASKDEDLRSALLPLGPIIPPLHATEKKEDLDLRVLPSSSGKRQSSEHMEAGVSKKTKAEKFDALFGNEDVDLRTLTHPKAGRPPTPPPPVISAEENKASWAKIKTPSKNDRDKQLNSDEKDKERSKDRNKDRSSRPRIYNKLSDDNKDRRRLFNDDDIRQNRRNNNRGDIDKTDRNNSDRSIEIFMKQAEEQFNQGTMLQSEYHKIIQRCWQMNEEEKLKAAQRKEKEIGSIVWEKNMDIGGGSFSPDSTDINHHARNGPRWQQPWQQVGPWAHQAQQQSLPPLQPQFNTDFRPIGPWQGPRGFGPMRPDFNQFPHAFNPNMGPRMNPMLNPSMIPPLGLPPNSLNNNLNGPPGLLHNNGPLSQVNNLINHPRGILSDSQQVTNCVVDDINPTVQMLKDNIDSRIVSSSPDEKIIDQVNKDTMKSINIDGVPREIRYYGQTGVVFISWDDPREIGFQDGLRAILIDDKDTIVCGFNEPYKEFIFDNEVHRIRLGGPTRELYIDDKWYECYFGGPPIIVDLGNKKVNIKLEGPPPQVKIGSVKRTDLVVGKINLIINARNMVPVFLDSKPQTFELDGKQHTIEFIDSLKNVLINGQVMPVYFGGLPKSITIGDKKHFIRFSILPRGIRAGNVRIMGMKGDKPPEIEGQIPCNLLPGQNKIDLPINSMTNLNNFDNDNTNSQDPSDATAGSKPDLQLDMLSSALSSAMAPSSGLSYQAEQTDNKANNLNNQSQNPILPLNIDMNELFQRLVATGIVPKVESEVKKTEVEVKKEPEIVPVSFDKPETLKVKQPAMVLALYSGMQCSSCGVRFPPELATKYSQHLDWHFRQNRKERDTAKKTHSRPWYYDVNDWIQFEEIEDLEYRQQSWFETEKQSEMDSANADDLSQDAILASVPTGSDEDGQCHVCHDAFEQFYNEEKEEWHLRPAVSFEGKNYHPLCLEDHKKSLEKSALALDETMTEMEDERKEDLDETIDEEGMEKSEAKEESSTDENAGDIVAAETQEEAQEVSDTTGEKVEAEADKIEDKIVDEIPGEGKDEKNNEEAMEIEIKEAVNDEKEIEPEIMECSFDKVKIKEEPIEVHDDGQEMSFNYENVVIKTEPVDPEPEPEVPVQEAGTVDTTLAAVTSSIDGNVELESAPATLPAAPSRIKINITKPLLLNKEPAEEPKEKPQNDAPIEEERPLLPAKLKPALEGRKFAVYPAVEKGQEMSGLCSIM